MSELTTEIARLETELTNQVRAQKMALFSKKRNNLNSKGNFQEEEAESYLSYKRLASQNAIELADLQLGFTF